MNPLNVLARAIGRVLPALPDRERAVLQGALQQVQRQLAARKESREQEQEQERAKQVWLTPTQAKISYDQVWTVRTRSRQVCKARVSSYRRTNRGLKRWSGVNIDTGRTVSITKVLKGSLR